MINLDEYPLLSRNMATLRETSKDTSGQDAVQYMTSSELTVINFDLVKRAYANALGLSEEAAASVDAVAAFTNEILFVEFKNGKVNNRNVKDKARDSLLIFLDIIGKSIDFSRKTVDFVVVYNSEKNPLPNQAKKGQLQETPSRVDIGIHFMAKAEKELVLFDLEKYERLYFRKVHTYPKERFEEHLQKMQ